MYGIEYNVVAKSIPWLIAPLRCSVNERELSLVIYVQGKNISKKSWIHENILP